MFQHHVDHIYYKSGKHQTLDTCINGDKKYLWTQSMSNKLGRLELVKDVGVKSNDCVDFINY